MACSRLQYPQWETGGYSRLFHDCGRDAVPPVTLGRKGYQGRSPWLVSLLAHVAPLGWEHIALTGDYVWSTADAPEAFRPLRDVRRLFLFEAA